MLHTFACLAVSLAEVKRNFTRYGLLDDQVCFLEGWFKDTFPTAPINQIAVLRLDGDMYESTTDALVHLYDKVSPGGYVIIDDYGCIGNCKAAVDDFRRSRRITDPIQQIDWSGIFWRRPPTLGVAP
jgi:O-methyltransferase